MRNRLAFTVTVAKTMLFNRRTCLMRHGKHMARACVIALFVASSSGAAEYETQTNKPVSRWWRTATCIGSP